MATQLFRPKPSSRGFATVDILAGATGVSDPINLSGLTLCSIQMSAAWTDAAIGFNACVDGTTNYQPVYNTAGDHLTYPTSANRVVVFDPAVFAGLQTIQLVSKTTAGVAVQQGAIRTVKLGLAELVQAD